MPHNYAGNTNKDKEQKVAPEEEKVVQKVTTGTVVKKKQPLGQRFKAIFFGGDSKSAARYVAADVLLPAIKNLLVDTTTKGVERLVYGDSRPTRRPGFDYRSRVQYNSPLMRSDPRTGRLPDQGPRMTRRETSDLVLASREEADLVLERLLDILDKYDVASVADLYELTGLPTSHVDNKWGWTQLHNTEVRQVRDGWLLNLPPAEEI